LLASVLSSEPTAETDAKLKERLKQYGLMAACAVYSADGNSIARASTVEPEPEWSLLTPSPVTAGEPARKSQGSSQQSLLAQAIVRTEGDLQIAEARVADGRTVVVARPAEGAPLPTMYYIFSYQLVALVLGLCMVAMLVRWLLRPYRRMVEAARG